MKERILKVGKGVLVALALVVGFSSCEKKEDTPIAMTEVSQVALPQDAQASVNSARAKWCWCTDYIKNRLGYWGVKAGDAKDMGSWLTKIGWKKVPSFSATDLPRNKDIIIFQPGAHGAHSSAGHIGMVASAQNVRGNILVRIVGANHEWKGKNKRPTWTEYDCTNVSIWEIQSLQQSGVSLYRK